MPEFVRNGIKLYYEDLGDSGARETVAFLNGVMASTGSWEALYPAFQKLGYRVILHDFKGQLKSDKPAGEYTFAEHAEEARALFAHLGVEKPHLIGTSYGGEVAMKFALLFPHMAKSITIIDSVSEIDEVLRGFVDSWIILCDTGDGEAFFRGMTPSIYSRRFIREQRDMLNARAKQMKLVPPDYFEGQKTLYNTFKNDVFMTDQLPNISCPALVICGGDDLLKPPRFSKIIAENIPGSEYFIIPDCGHVAIFEKPRELLSVMTGFILKHSTLSP